MPVLAAAVLASTGCSDGSGGSVIPPPDPPAAEAALTHDFGEITLDAGQEIASQCVVWTLNNDKPLYVSTVTLSNGGAYHHSNWFVVPESLYPGADGYFDCDERGFDELGSAVNGTVIFAQSTQSQVEVQSFVPGAVIKVPPRHKVVSGVHLLNPTNRESTTFLRMSLGLVHPSEVDVILAPFRLSYYSLDIPPRADSHFTMDCDMATLFEQVAKRPFDMKLYWVLPHYHYLGSYFRVEVIGGDKDGHVIHTLDTFNAEANGKTLDPPLDLTGTRGLRLTCGYSNPRDESVGWGIGDQEMCVMLGLADSDVLLDLYMDQENQVDGVVNGVVKNSGPCGGISVPRNAAQTLPSQEEIDAPLYVPESLPGDDDLPPVPVCVDTPPEIFAEPPATLSSIEDGIFTGSCTFSACHDTQAPAGGLDLASPGLHARLLSHTVLSAQTDLPLIAPGNPEGSWLYRVLSQCEPRDDAGRVVAHMPRNAPTLLAPELVAKVRDWIVGGAQDG